MVSPGHLTASPTCRRVATPAKKAADTAQTSMLNPAQKDMLRDVKDVNLSGNKAWTVWSVVEKSWMTFRSCVRIDLIKKG